jgi:AP-2 complex subunit alpha
MRFLALEGLTAMAQTEFSNDAVKRHMPSVLKALKNETDSTVQRRCVDVLYAICDKVRSVGCTSGCLLPRTHGRSFGC